MSRDQQQGIALVFYRRSDDVALRPLPDLIIPDPYHRAVHGLKECLLHDFRGALTTFSIANDIDELV